MHRAESRTAPLQFSRGEGLWERGHRVALAVSFGRVSTTVRVNTFLASCRYGCILPYCDEDGGPLHQLKM